MARPLAFLLGVVAALAPAAPATAADLVPRLLAPSLRTLEPSAGRAARRRGTARR